MDPYASAINPLSNLPTLVPGPSPTGWFINPAKFSQKPAFVPAQDYPLTLTSGQTKTTRIFASADQGADGDVEFYYPQCRSNGQISVKLKWTHFALDLQNGPVESSLIFGSGQFAARLLSPVYVPANSSLEITCTDLSAGANEVHASAIGAQIVDPVAIMGARDAQVRRAVLLDRNKHPFWLTFDDGAQQAIADATTTEYVFTVPSHADFNCWGMVHRLSSITNEEDFHVEILEGKKRAVTGGYIGLGQISSRTASVTGVQDGLLTAAGTPMFWPFTWLVRRGTQIIVRVKNTTGGSRTFSIAFPGELVNHLQAPPQFAVGPLANRKAGR